ncbi:MAG: sensor histidine kinase [Agriterribacter sp.]|nr:MAG: hypothetical protein BGP13_21155 [Sphingobacteriales bacterium 40-81]
MRLTLSAFKNLSLQKRLPLFVCLLLTGAVTLFSIISYLSIKKFELKAGEQRLLDLTQQAGNMFSESIREDYTNTRRVIADTIIPAFITKRTELLQKQADSILEQIGHSGSSLYAEILDTNYNPLLSAGDPFYLPDKNSRPHYVKKIMSGDLYGHNDSVFYSLTLPVMEAGKLTGYVTRYRFVKITSKMVLQFSTLAGYGAKLYVANKNNSFCTDLFKPVQYTLPVDQTQADKSYSYKNENGTRMVGAFRFVPDTPWLVALEFPYSVIVQGSSKFLFWLLVLGTILIICGITAAWIIGKNLVRPLNQLTNAVTNLSSGEFAEVPVNRNDEVGKLAQAFNEMTLSLKDAKTKMEEKINEAEHLNTQLRKLSAHQQNIREEERKRIAREMHDELGQLLTGFKMDVQLLKNHLPAGSNERVKEHIQSMTSLVDDAIRFVRRLSSQLREGPLEDLGLIAAIQWYTQEFTRRYNIPVIFNCLHSDISLPPQVKTGLFRICQESLTNIARHSNATRVEINFDIQNNELLLTVKDNGKGFKTSTGARTGSLGLLGMNERAIMVGARLSLHSEIGKGTMIKVAFPINEKEAFI